MHNELQDGERCGITAIAVVLAIAAMLAAVFLAMGLSGCASYSVDRETGEGHSWGFLRSISVTETRTYGPDGKVTAETVTISTASNTGDVLMGANEVLGTMIDGASKVKP